MKEEDLKFENEILRKNVYDLQDQLNVAYKKLAEWETWAEDAIKKMDNISDKLEKFTVIHK